jgi:uncharacterized protein DUF4232
VPGEAPISATPRRTRLAGLATALLAAALLTALAVTTATSPPALAATATGAPKCSTSRLVVWLDTQGSGAAGSVFYRVELTNLSGHTCAIVGYPRVAAVGLSGRQIGSGSGRSVSSKPLVTLANRATASIVLQLVDVGNFPAAACRPVTAAGLRVFPPHENASKVVPFPFRACSRSGPTFLWAQAVRPHA